MPILVIVVSSVLFGMCLGTLCADKVLGKGRPVYGTLKINVRNPEEESMKLLLEMDDVEELAKHDEVILRIDVSR